MGRTSCCFTSPTVAWAEHQGKRWTSELGAFTFDSDQDGVSQTAGRVNPWGKRGSRHRHSLQAGGPRSKHGSRHGLQAGGGSGGGGDCRRALDRLCSPSRPPHLTVAGTRTSWLPVDNVLTCKVMVGPVAAASPLLAIAATSDQRLVASRQLPRCLDGPPVALPEGAAAVPLLQAPPSCCTVWITLASRRLQLWACHLRARRPALALPTV